MIPASTPRSAEPVAPVQPGSDLDLLAGLIGLPHRDGAAGPDAYDCWNLCAHVQAILFGRRLPFSDDLLAGARGPRAILDMIRTSDLHRHWIAVTRPRHGDLVLMAKGRAERHIGTWIDCGAGFTGILHSTDPGGVMLQTTAQVRAAFPTMTYRRCADRTLDALARTDRTYLPHVSDAPVAIVVHDLLDPLGSAEIRPLAPGAAASSALDHVADADARWLVLNDMPLMRRNPETGAGEHDRPLEQGDLVWVLPPTPLGGGDGSQVLASLMAVVVSIAAPWAAGIIAPGLAATSLQFKLLTAGIAIAGNALIQSLVPQQAAPAALANPDPTYSFGRFGNQMRPGATIPRPYGTMHRQPDLLAPVYAEFEDNDQLVHVLLCIGLGDHELREFGIDDTPVWTAEGGLTDAIADVSFELVPPGAVPSLFPTAIEVNSEVDGLELPEPDGGTVTIGPIAAVSSGQTAIELVFDFVFPRGLFEFSGGKERDTTVSWQITAQQIDEFGQLIGGELLLDTVTYTAGTTTPQRLTRRYPVGRGRYQVSVARTSASTITGTGAQDQLVWAGLRAKRVDSEAYPRVTALAIRVRADATSQRGLTNWYTITTARLPHFDTATDEIVTGPTEAIDAAILDIARAGYGLQLPDERIDLDQLAVLARTWAARGDVCCTAMESDQSAWDALTAVCRAGRTRPSFVGMTLTFVRDEPRPVPSRLITHADMVRGSFEVERVHFRRDTPRGVNMIYRDRRGTMRSMLIPPDANPVLAAEVRSEVHVDAAQVWRDGNFMEAENRLRRRFVSWVGLSGAASLLPGELVEIAHPRPRFGAPGRVTRRDGLRINLSAPHGLSAGESGWLALSYPDGGYWGPVACAAAGERAVQIVEEDLQQVIETGIPRYDYEPDFRAWLVTEADGAPLPDATQTLGRQQSEATRAIVGGDATRAFRALIVGVQPSEDGRVEVLAVEYVAEVHTAETAPMPPQPEPAVAVQTATRPPWGASIVGEIDTGVTPNLAAITITGPVVPGAVRYVAEVSAGASPDGWTRLGENTQPTIDGAVPVPDGRYIRVAADGPVLVGTWTIYVLNFANANELITTGELVEET